MKAPNSFQKNERRTHHSTNKFAAVQMSRDKRKQELDTVRNKKSSVLRKYAKLCKAEGVVSDRVNLGTSINCNAKAKVNDQIKPVSRLHTKTLNSGEKLDSIADNSADSKKKASESRSVKRQQMLQKTRKGQPVMRNQITSILNKLTKSQ